MALKTCNECGTQISDQAKTCPKCGVPDPVPKNTHVGILIVSAFVILGAIKLAWPNDPKPSAVAPMPASPAVALAAANTAKLAELEVCKGSIEQKKAAYRTLLDKREFWDAALELGDCPNVMKDQALIAMQTGARRLSYLETAGSAKAAPDQRLTAIQQLRTYYPDDAKQFAAAATKLQTEVDANTAANLRRVDAAEKTRKRKEGVSIGMSKEDVLASSWGKPQSINSSTYSFGTHEQWVYGGHNYLYFENGILKSIQN